MYSETSSSDSRYQPIKLLQTGLICCQIWKNDVANTAPYTFLGVSNQFPPVAASAIKLTAQPPPIYTSAMPSASASCRLTIFSSCCFTSPKTQVWCTKMFLALSAKVKHVACSQSQFATANQLNYLCSISEGLEKSTADGGTYVSAFCSSFLANCE